MSLLSASTLQGTNVTNPSGEGLGDIKDLMIDVSTGRVAYAVVEFGGLLGIGSKLFAVPMQAMKQNAGKSASSWTRARKPWRTRKASTRTTGPTSRTGSGRRPCTSTTRPPRTGAERAGWRP